MKQDSGVCVVRIDGLQLPEIFAPGRIGHLYDLELLPGPHELSVVYFTDASVVGGGSARSEGALEVSFIAQAGHVYKVGAKLHTDVSWRPGVRDSTTWLPVVEDKTK